MHPVSANETAMRLFMGLFAYLIVTASALAAPIATVTPTSFSLTVAANRTATDTLNIANALGADPLTFSITGRAAASAALLRPPVVQRAGEPLRTFQVASLGSNGGFGGASSAAARESLRPHGSVNFQVDDGNYEDNIGFGTVGPPATEWGAVWINRFHTSEALTIDSISITWPTNDNASLLGLEANLLAYYDADADGNATNALRLGTNHLVTISALDVFEVYATNFNVPGAGDVYIGFVDQWAIGHNFQPRLFPAAIDQSSPSQLMSYVSAPSFDPSLPPVDIDDLGNNPATGEIGVITGGTYFGNWLIRATGTAAGSCTGPILPWLSVDPVSGLVNGGENLDVTITGSPLTGHLTEGSYVAELCITTNDPSQPLFAIPVNLTVTAPVPGFCDGGAETIFCDNFDLGAARPN